MDKLARGRVYYGNEGKNFNLIDLIGDLNNAIEIASKLAKIDKYQIIEYPKEKSDFEKILLSFQTQFSFYPIISKNDNWLIKNIINDKRFDPFQMRIQYKID